MRWSSWLGQYSRPLSDPGRQRTGYLTLGPPASFVSGHNGGIGFEMAQWTLASVAVESAFDPNRIGRKAGPGLILFHGSAHGLENCNLVAKGARMTHCPHRRFAD